MFSVFLCTCVIFFSTAGHHVSRSRFMYVMYGIEDWFQEGYENERE